jgi:hypothetical protein
MTDEREQLGTEELEDASAVALPEREMLSIGSIGDEIVDLNYDHPYLPPEIDGYEPPEDPAA